MDSRDLRHLANLGRCARAVMALVRPGSEDQAVVELEGIIEHASSLGYHDEWPGQDLRCLLKR